MNHNPTIEPEWAFSGVDRDKLKLEDLNHFATAAAHWQYYANWHIGDVAKLAEIKSPDYWSQVFPEWMSPDLIARCLAVSKAYPQIKRNPLATWTIHMKYANDPDRIAKVAAHVEAGHTSDEARKTTVSVPEKQEPETKRWLIAIDVNYYVNSAYHSGAGVESASQVTGKIKSLVERLKLKGLSDAVCCFDGPNNHRKLLTEGWEKQYKASRKPKEPELIEQIHLVRDMLAKAGFCCVSIPGMEADDLMATYAVKFPGQVTLHTADKDARQCLSKKCNLLTEIEWIQDATSGTFLPKDHWVTEAKHTADGCPYQSTLVTGITPKQWPDFQAIAGDSVDNIAGVEGIGATGAAALITTHGTLANVIAAAVSGDIDLTPKKLAAMLEFSNKYADVTMQLVTMRTDLDVPFTTGI